MTGDIESSLTQGVARNPRVRFSIFKTFLRINVGSCWSVSSETKKWAGMKTAYLKQRHRCIAGVKDAYVRANM